MGIMDDTLKESVSAAAKVTPPTLVTTGMLFGHPVDDWVKVATLLYIIVQITALVVGKWLRWKGLLKGRDDDEQF